MTLWTMSSKYNDLAARVRIQGNAAAAAAAKLDAIDSKLDRVLAAVSMQKLADYEGKKFVSIQKADVKLDESEEEKKRFSKLKDMYKPLTDWWKEIDMMVSAHLAECKKDKKDKEDKFDEYGMKLKKEKKDKIEPRT